jgi:hypothetical protein
VLDTLMATWRSETLPWLALGSFVALMAIMRAGENEPPQRQNAYVSREACERDYEPAQCRENTGVHGGYYGPRYSSDRMTMDDPGPGRTADRGHSQAASSVHTVRGGFGGTGRGYGGGYG